MQQNSAKGWRLQSNILLFTTQTNLELLPSLKKKNSSSLKRECKQFTILFEILEVLIVCCKWILRMCDEVKIDQLSRFVVTARQA